MLIDLNFNLKIDKGISIHIHEQIYIQLKNQILTGELEPGNRLPSVRQLSKLMNISRHTISRAYFKLEEEGFVETHASSGTFVKDNIERSNSKQIEELLNMIEDLFVRAEKMNFEREEVAQLTHVVMMGSTKEKLKGLFVECNRYALNEYVKDIENELNLSVDGCLLTDDRLNSKSGFIDIDQYDIIMTTMGHYAELKGKLKAENIYALNFGPYFSIINQIKQLDEKTNITIVCISKEGSYGLLNVLIDFGIPEKRLKAISIGNGEELNEFNEKIVNADVLVVSKFALLKNNELFENLGKPVIEYKNVLQRASVNMIKQIMKMHTN